jgi:hypothetical protein
MKFLSTLTDVLKKVNLQLEKMSSMKIYNLYK